MFKTPEIVIPDRAPRYVFKKIAGTANVTEIAKKHALMLMGATNNFC